MRMGVLFERILDQCLSVMLNLYIYIYIYMVIPTEESVKHNSNIILNTLLGVAACFGL
jgi:hypothetical protein